MLECSSYQIDMDRFRELALESGESALVHVNIILIATADLVTIRTPTNSGGPVQATANDSFVKSYVDAVFPAHTGVRTTDSEHSRGDSTTIGCSKL
ncbi:MAG: hypothetical protein BMS9Abin05_1291 [Rhodothermia bacterium]|nr:MAG: hypothetical protein BMS9Abin05_1291 [Rhodothermia bacterium]